MKFLIAPNAFKGTIAADKAASIIGQAIAAQFPDAQLEESPIADGGDGTCDLLAEQMHLDKKEVWALNAVGRPAKAHLFLDRKSQTAYLDVSTVSGLQGLEPFEVDALLTSTYGTGELIRKAVEMGAEHIVLGLGGSATVDMGTGILRALGIIFLDAKGRELTLFSPSFLSKIAHIQRPPTLPRIRFTCLCDVKNPFFGENGAIPVFGPQKGLKQQDLLIYEQDAMRLFEKLKKKSLTGLVDQPGFGAAGGIALGLSAFFPLNMEEGARYFFKQVGMSEKIKNSDRVITGEGRYDSQSAEGKGSYELLQLAQQHAKIIYLITSGNEGSESGFDGIIRLNDLDLNSPDLRAQAENNLYEAVNQFMKKMT